MPTVAFKHDHTPMSSGRLEPGNQTVTATRVTFCLKYHCEPMGKTVQISAKVRELAEELQRLARQVHARSDSPIDQCARELARQAEALDSGARHGHRVV